MAGVVGISLEACLNSRPMLAQLVRTELSFNDSIHCVSRTQSTACFKVLRPMDETFRNGPRCISITPNARTIWTAISPQSKHAAKLHRTFSWLSWMCLRHSLHLLSQFRLLPMFGFGHQCINPAFASAVNLFDKRIFDKNVFLLVR